MRTVINYHFHDHRSSDGSEPLWRHCEAAIAAGAMDICVTNHAEVLGADGAWVADPDEMRTRFLEVGREVSDAADRFPELRIRLGVELEYRREWTDAFDRLTGEVPFDFVLGSVHFVDGFNVSGGPDRDRFFEGRTQAEAYGRYFEEIGEMVAWGGFDAVGHFDLVKRYGHSHYGSYEPASFRDVITQVLESMAEREIGIEMNTSGVSQAPERPYPEVEILTWAREVGVPFLTMGSDSHVPERFSQGLRAGIELAGRAGWRQVALFERRRQVEGRSLNMLSSWARLAG